MEASSSKANDLAPEGLELEDLLSELHALKKLYGLLQKRDVTIANGDSSHEFLDEKSKHVLKKLLDSAIHQALQSQAKIVCYTPEPPQPLEEAENLELKTLCSIEREEDNHEKFQKFKQDAMQRSKTESVHSSSPLPKAKPSQSRPKHEPDSRASGSDAEAAQSSGHHVPMLKLAEQKLERTPCPSISKGNLTRQNSRRSAAISEKRSTQRHPHHHDPRSSKPRTRNNTNKQNESQNQKLDGHEQVKPSRSNGDLLANVPAVKRARGGPIVLLPGQSSRNQTCVAGRIDRELIHSVRGDTKETVRLKDRDSKSLALRDQNSIQRCIKERPRPQQTNRGGPLSKPPSRLGSLKERETKSISALRDQYQSVNSRRGKPRRMKSIAYSSSSRTMQSDTSATSSSSPCRFKRKMGSARPPPPCRRPSRGRNGGMQPKKIKEKEEGRLKRFMNKLTVIFHHHHHHHLLLHDGGGGDMEEAAGQQRSGPLQRRHRSPWAYIKSLVHHTGGAGEGKGRELAAKGHARVPAQQRQRGYLYAMLEGLVRHVWRTRRRNAGGRKMGGRGKGTKLRWWQRFRRRRRGFKIPNKQKMPRLRLAFHR